MQIGRLEQFFKNTTEINDLMDDKHAVCKLHGNHPLYRKWAKIQQPGQAP
jgi:hypothetical protein